MTRGGYGWRVSKAFTSEETQEAPVVVAPRPPIPAGVTNYVTPRDWRRSRKSCCDSKSRCKCEGIGDEPITATVWVASRKF